MASSALSIRAGELDAAAPAISGHDTRSLALAAVGASRNQERGGVAARGKLVISAIDVNFPGSSVIQNVSLTCEPGEFVVVVGPSGSGKSTLLNVAAGMLKPARGSVELDGVRTIAPGPDRAMVFAEHGLFPWLTAAENIGFGLKMLGTPKSELEARVDAALRLVHLQTKGDKLIHQLSTGMKQRVAIARALVMDPAVLMMDEPFAALDAQTRTLLHAQLQEIWTETKKTILFVTHSVGEAVRLADRIVILHAHPGRIRREVKVPLAHPRDFDSEAISEIARLVRKEIEDEVNRVNAEMAEEYWNPQADAHLGDHSHIMGDGI
ncbi:MAG TPA: ABC transporter ATP-binding protein [Tepidisphaeraceae bacterium]|nr:ABC transporter ATP-binding protein [Tepidisphaeraceae bacterium]